MRMAGILFISTRTIRQKSFNHSSTSRGLTGKLEVSGRVRVVRAGCGYCE